VLSGEYDASDALVQQELGRVVGILVELEAALDPSSSEELAILLRRTYRTLRKQVVEASANLGVHALEQVKEQLVSLLDTWRHVAKETETPSVRRIVDRRRKNRR